MSQEAGVRGAAEAVRASFRDAFTHAGAPRNAALFEAPIPQGTRFYFSPGAAVLFEAHLRTFRTARTGAPPAEASLAVGDPATWARMAP